VPGPANGRLGAEVVCPGRPPGSGVREARVRAAEAIMSDHVRPRSGLSVLVLYRYPGRG
jgi:hypothetical protein